MDDDHTCFKLLATIIGGNNILMPKEREKTEKDWNVLVNEYSFCKRKLQSKRAALQVVSYDLERVTKEKDHYKVLLKKFINTCHCNHTKKFTFDAFEASSADKLDAHIYNIHDENTHLRQNIDSLKQELDDLRGDVKLLRGLLKHKETLLSRDSCDGRWQLQLVQQLEIAQEQVARYTLKIGEMEDLKEETISDRNSYKVKCDRLNEELSKILGGDVDRMVDIDEVKTENCYLKARLKQSEEEKKHLYSTMSRLRQQDVKSKKSTSSSLQQVQEFVAGHQKDLPQSASNELQNLSMALLETVNDKNLALAHLKSTNKILGLRVAELEKRSKLSNSTAGHVSELVGQFDESRRESGLCS